MIRIGICGYGNLGKGVEAAVKNAPDMQLVAVFTRRDPSGVTTNTPGVPVVSYSALSEYRDKIDVIVNCGGSATDLPETTPYIASLFNVIDSFDTHAKIPAHFDAVNAAAKASGKIGVISVGWDPGLFSLARLYGCAVLPVGADYTFWGRGVSQGHSDAIRRIDGVLDARQYTVPVEDAMAKVRAGQTPTFTTREKHKRECYVVAKEGADLEKIERAIKTMPNYFADYNTNVTFISMEELKEKHMGIPHGGSVIRNGKTGMHLENGHTAEFRLKLDSNPEFTGSVLLAFARAASKLSAMGESGAKTVLDIAPVWLVPDDGAALRSHLL